MLDILLFIVLGILSREYFYIIPMVLIFSAIYFFKNKFNKKKIIILLVFLIFSFSQSYIRFNDFNDEKTIKDRGIITEVSEYEQYNRITIRSGLNKYYSYDKLKEFRRGDRVDFKGLLTKHQNRTMPYLFDSRDFYYSNAVNYKLDNAYIEYKGKTVLSKLEDIRLMAAEVFETRLNRNASIISKGITLRYREDSPVLNNIIDVGLSHILSVSGLHLGIIFFLIFNIISLTGLGIKSRSVIASIIMLIYCFIIGFTPSLLRALIMIYVIMYKRIYRPGITTKDALIIAAIISLIINPYYIYSIGFILSYLCMFGILYIFNRLDKIFVRDLSLKNKLKSAFILNISIQIATFPVVIYYFNKVNVFSILLNIILVPIFSIYLMLSMMLLLVSKLTVISSIVVFLLNNISNVFDFISSIFNKDSFNLILRSPNIVLIFLYFIFLLYMLNLNKLKVLRLNYNILLIILIILSVPSPLNFKNNNRVEFLDVGQGDAALISIGNKKILIDSGGNPFNRNFVGSKIVEPYLIKTGKRKIDFGIITHFDYDHVGGFTEMSDNIKINRLFTNHAYEGSESEDLSERIKNLNYQILKEDALLKINKEYSLKLIPGNKNLTSENDRSLVCVLRKNDKNLIYFCGDIEVDGEESVVDNSPKTFILKSPHHGSRSSSTDIFLDKIDTKNVVISVGRNNKFGHPNFEVIKRYQDRNYNIYRTDQDGLITLDLNSLKFYRYLNYDIYTVFLIYIQFIFSLFIVLYKEEIWNIQSF